MEPVRNDTTTDRRTAVELAKRLLVDLIWRTAKIEVDGVTFPDTQEIFDGRAPEGMSVDDIVTVNNIKRAWRFLLGNIDYPVDWQYIREYNRIIGEGLVRDAGRLREYGVRVGGTGWVPEIPAVESSQERVRGILEESEGEDTAMLLFGAVTRGQWFSDGNKRTALMVANHQLIHDGIGVFSILAVMHHTQAFGLGFDEVDALTGPKIGRPKSATYRTADVVGLDTLAHVVRNMHGTLPDDPWHAHFKVPAWLEQLIAQGALGQKTKGGIYRKVGKEVHVLDLGLQDFRPSSGELSAEVAGILKDRNPASRFAALRASKDPQAKFLWAIFRDVFHYAAVQLESIADNARDLDLAMRWGFGWTQGPFEIWQSAGWADIARAIAADIAAGETMSDTPLPAWVLEDREGVHTPQGSWSPRRKAYVPRSALPVYQRQLFQEAVLGDGSLAPEQSGETLFENDGVRLWRLPAVDAGIGILSFKSKMHAIGSEVVDGVVAAVRQAEQSLSGLVIWHQPPFAVGANLAQVAEGCAAGDFAQLDRYVAAFQQAGQALKYAAVPVVAAVQGMALGGGCEFAMQATRRVVALESYMGLVEAGVGLIPAGGGCKEFALQAAEWAGRTATPAELMAFLQPVFMNIATAKVSKSAAEAVGYGFARATDTVLFHPDELLYVAIREARALAESGYAPPATARAVPVAGRGGIATLEMTLVNMRDGGMISAYDYQVARAAAVALCGGEVDSGSLVDEAWLLTVERRLFVELLKNPQTQARIQHMLETGKPLRN